MSKQQEVCILIMSLTLGMLALAKKINVRVIVAFITLIGIVLFIPLLGLILVIPIFVIVWLEDSKHVWIAWDKLKNVSLSTDPADK